MSDSNLLQAFNEGLHSIKEMFSVVDGKVNHLTSKLDEAHEQIAILEARLQKLKKRIMLTAPIAIGLLLLIKLNIRRSSKVFMRNLEKLSATRS